MRKPSLPQLVHNTIFPHPSANDPDSFAAFVVKKLVPEVRLETSRFYGHLDCIEAQYPGLDYSYGPHRMRLGRFQWHRRLFKTFDELGLTNDEMMDMCCWEGTKSARARYELMEGTTVRDTIGHSTWQPTPTPLPSITVHDDFYGLEDDYDQLIETRSDDTVRASDTRSSSVFSGYRSHEHDEDSSDEEVTSCGLPLQHQLIANVEARDQGADVPLDAAWEQWLKESRERGSYSDMLHGIRADAHLSLLPEVPISAIRYEEEHTNEAPLPLANTLSAESFLYTTSNLYASSPILPQSSNHTPGEAR
ncbi:hypothetical protein N7478_004190 [Penicillium angulare]|uniref:uncharacterized protein n=1 Tax=Penicillium angulare TaxID=116970 RepID=UPI0025405650|nr:uncharacterized protein N7478_004190 [Penicillium angulare]KAJ5278818.1 hypothetical protein N7478_004190 [Penicillium angulare]